MKIKEHIKIIKELEDQITSLKKNIDQLQEKIKVLREENEGKKEIRK